MFTKRIIPCLDVKDGRVVKGVNFVDLRDAGDPVEIGAAYSAAGADELVFLDITASSDARETVVDMVRRVAENVFIPFTVGGGVRSMETIARYFAAGADRVILGAAAVSDEALLREAAAKFGEKIAVGADVRDGFIAIKGWLEKSELSLAAFLEKMQSIGIKTVICTDISRDGAMQGTNLELYARLNACYDMQIVASGGVSSLEDLRKLKEIGLFGAIIGKAYYTGAIDLREALEVSA